MNRNHLRMFFAVSAVAVFIAGSAQAAELATMHQVSGTIGMVNTSEGIMQLRVDSPQGTKEMREFRINLNDTRVTDSEDQDFLVVKDLRAGQYVTVELVDGNEDSIVQKIIVDSSSNTRYARDSVEQYTQDQITDGNQGYIVRESNASRADNAREDNASIVGPRGHTGAAGSKGEKGYTGVTGPTGVALMGPRGETGPAGPMGEQGITGPRGNRGTIERGAMGATGVAGSQGARGAIGATGEQGASLAGHAGPIGAAGPRGPQGPMGNRGDVGPTLVGPTGPAGYAGSTGDQGVMGAQGLRGSTAAGMRGETGSSGVMGAIGSKGETGEQGLTGMVDSWTLYREFYFDDQDNAIRSSDMSKVSDIAAYVKKNPSLQIGIDARGSNSANFNSVHRALIQAGVPSNRIEKGVFGDRAIRRNGNVEVYIRSAK